MRKAACGEFAQLDVLEFCEHPAEAFDDFVFEGGEQAFFVAEVIVERAAVQAGARAQVAHREAVDATFFDERDEGFAQRGAKRAMRGRAGCGGLAGAEAGATTAEAAGVGAAAAEAAGIAAGAVSHLRPGCDLVALPERLVPRAPHALFGGGIRCRQMSPLDSNLVY